MRRAFQLSAVLFALALVSSAGATTPGTNGRIAYARYTNGMLDLFSANADGSAERRLTWTNDNEQSPAWSPDGTQVAYSRAPASGGRWRIWVMNADGSGQRQLTPTPDDNFSDEIEPEWSPDGTLIAFASTRIDTYNIWVINAGGSGLRRLTTSFSDDPTWSPDARQIAYVGSGAVGIVNADGTNPHPVTGPGGWAGAPSWSPDGSRLVFYRNDDRGYPGELYTVNADGSNETQLTTGGFNNASPAWSPDGTKIIFGRSLQAPDAWHLWTMDADGSNPQQVSTAENSGPAWGTSQLVPDVSPPDAPQIQILSPRDGWLYSPEQAPSALYQCSSFVSWIVSCDGDVPLFAPVDVSTAGTHTFSVRAVDAEGRTATMTITYEVLDIIPPEINLRTPSNGASYDLGSTVTVDYSCSDPDKGGILFCSGDLPNGAPLDTNHAGTFGFNVTAVDTARHMTQTHVTYTVVDRSPPRINIQSPLAGHEYPEGLGVGAYYECRSPGGFGITSCKGTVPNGELFDTSGIGPHMFTVTATDANGKTTTTTAQYQVIYRFSGFDSPVDSGGNLTGARAGDGISLKFSLNGDHGLGIVSGGSWQTATCGNWTPTGPKTSTDAKLSYKASTDRYQEIVATSPSWKGTCRILQLDLADGTHPQVRVTFR